MQLSWNSTEHTVLYKSPEDILHGWVVLEVERDDNNERESVFVRMSQSVIYAPAVVNGGGNNRPRLLLRRG